MNARAELSCLLLTCAALNGCAIDPQYSAPYGEPVYLDFASIEVRRDQLDRYACLTGSPLFCSCFGHLSPTCECRCSFE